MNFSGDKNSDAINPHIFRFVYESRRHSRCCWRVEVYGLIEQHIWLGESSLFREARRFWALKTDVGTACYRNGFDALSIPKLFLRLMLRIAVALTTWSSRFIQDNEKQRYRGLYDLYSLDPLWLEPTPQITEQWHFLGRRKVLQTILGYTARACPTRVV